MSTIERMASERVEAGERLVKTMADAIPAVSARMLEGALARMGLMRKPSVGSGAGLFVGGLVVGAAAVALATPELRNRISDFVLGGSGDVKSRAQDLERRVEKKVTQVARDAQSVVSRAKVAATTPEVTGSDVARPVTPTPHS